MGVSGPEFRVMTSTCWCVFLKPHSALQSRQGVGFQGANFSTSGEDDGGRKGKGGGHAVERVIVMMGG